MFLLSALKTPITSIVVVVFTYAGYAQNGSAHIPSPDISNKNHPQFEIISIHESAPSVSYSQRVVNDSHSGLFIVTNFRMPQLIAAAFDVNFQFQVLDIPEEFQNRRFDINAKSDEATDRMLRGESDEQASRQKHRMILSLLADRFQLRYRIESRQLPSYELRVSPKGTKLRPLDQKDGAYTGFQTERTNQGIEVDGKNVAVDALPAVLSFYLKRTVINRTGLAGTYDLTLKFDNTLAGAGVESDEGWPPLQAAVQEQLGLILFPVKLSTPVVIVEHVEIPTPN